MEKEEYQYQYSLIDLQEKIDSLYESYISESIKSDRKQLHIEYKKYTKVYNSIVRFEAYKERIY